MCTKFVCLCVFVFLKQNFDQIFSFLQKCFYLNSLQCLSLSHISLSSAAASDVVNLLIAWHELQRKKETKERLIRKRSDCHLNARENFFLCDQKDWIF